MIDNIKNGENMPPELHSPIMKGYLREICEKLYKAPFFHSSTYGTYFVIDGMTKKGNSVLVVALDKKYRPVNQRRLYLSVLDNKKNFCSQAESVAASVGAKYLIVAKKGKIAPYLRELHFANYLYKNLETVKLYDYVTLENDSFCSYMENLR